MSLFKTKEWWRTVCGAQETFDGRCLLVTPLFGEEKKDAIVVGSHDGYLRIYSPSSQWIEETRSPSGYKSTDTMLETQIGDCIVDIKAGKFVSGSQDLRLAILTSSKLLVYNAILIDGSTEYGDRCDLKVAYEHSLPRHPASLTTGPFGGVRGRDFLCVQCLDGTLFFYEQEVFVFSQVLKNRLLPEPIVYIARNDLFVTASTSWFLECYRYDYRFLHHHHHRQRQWQRERRPIPADSHEPDWRYNIGEAILDIQAVTLSSFEAGIVVLGERHLYCLKDNCTSVKYAKRLEYKPLCFRAYVIEPDGKLMVLVIADTSTLMIYEGTRLKWSAQLPFAPVTVARAQLQHLDGAIMALSEEGRLEACYLGSEPGLFIAPPLHSRRYDYAAAEQQLADLRALLKRKKSSEDRANDATLDAELIIAVNVSPEDSARSSNGDRSNRNDQNDRQDGQSNRLHAEWLTTLRDVQVCIDVRKPLIATDTFCAISNLHDRHSIETRIHVDGDLPAIACEIDVIVSYRRDTEDGNLRTVRKTSQLPLKMMLQSCPPENVTTFTTVLKGDDHQPLLGLARLFPEFTGDRTQTGQKQNWTALGLRYTRNGQGVTIVSGNASNRYRVQSNDGLSTTLVVRQLIDRLADRKYGNLSGTIGQDHLRLMHSRIEAHYNARRKIDGITNAIGLLTIQLRNIEKKMLRAVRERNTGSSLSDTGLPFLFESTYRAILERLEDLVEARAERERAGHELYCSARLLLLILRMNTNEEKYATIEAAIGFEPRPCDKLDWEEIADAALATILRSVTKNPGTTETKSITWNSITPFASVKELAKLKKRLGHAIERLDEAKGSDIAEIEPNDLASS
ncbi:Protein PTHB1 [Dufourea novaeangliae]|uniref:Protein PTHB1 n=1 Tax=Dufourea novaeangliae TaxID=178035 RepID=A0A154PRD2_DUFNO|nr:Protein PTHB1 [Dufourea novaeangliae]